MRNENVKVVGGSELRCGYTTGSCAAAAAAAAAEMLLAGGILRQAEIKLPAGEKAVFDIENIDRKESSVKCSVTKDGGDDPDVTDGAEIFAEVSLTDRPGTAIRGGEGVGRVTALGLQCAVGEAAINPVPRKMITDSIAGIAGRFGYAKGFTVEISVPGGAAIARQTYNPRLGITGGISILGTSGVVEPMSEKAIVDTIKVEMDRRYAENQELILISPGNYGRDFCRDQLHLDIDQAVQISNYVGEALDYIRYKGFAKVLLVGHMGKLVKIAAGVMNTHSSYADCRMETIAAHSACCGADEDTVRKILECVTTDNALDLIKDEPYYEETKARILDRMLCHLNFRLKGAARIEAVVFSSGSRHIVMSGGAESFIEEYMEERK